MRFRLKVQGLDAVIEAVRRAGERGRDAMRRALRAEGETIMTAAKLETPVDFGTLRSTGHISQPLDVAHGAEITLAFGGPAAPYAVVQHERLDYRHTVGKAKYLEDPAKAAQQGMAERLAAVVAQAVEGSSGGSGGGGAGGGGGSGGGRQRDSRGRFI